MTLRILVVIAGTAVGLGAAELLGGRPRVTVSESRTPVPRQVAATAGPLRLSVDIPPTEPPAEALEAAPPADGAVPEAAPFLLWSEVVTESGEAVPGAVVLIGDLDAPSWSDTADGEGRFLLTEFPSYATLRAVAVRDGEAWSGSTLADGGPFSWTVVVRPPASCYERVVVVRVLDSDGRPIPRVTAVPVSGRARGEAPAREGFAVSGGAFVVPAARWHRREVPVFLLAEPRDERDRPLPLGEATVAVDPAGPAETEVRLPAGGLVGGRLLASDGSPRSGGRVTFRQREIATPGLARAAELLTDEDGRFQFASGPCGGLLQATDLAGSVPVAAAPGQPEAVIRLREEAPFRLLVVDARGAPVESGHAYAEVVGEEPRHGKGSIAADGTCTLSGLPAGCEVALAVSAPGCIRHEGRYRVDGSLLRIDLSRSAAIAGRVVDSDGEGVPGAMVFASAPGNLPVSWSTADVTGTDGSFSLDGIPPGAAVRLSVGDGRSFVLSRDVVSGSEPEILLPLPASEEFLLVYVDGGDGRPESAPVVVSSGGRVIARGYAFNLPALVAIPAGDLPDRVDVTVGPTSWYGKHALLHGVASDGIVRPVMEDGATVKGCVLRADGGEAAFARVRVQGEGGLAVEIEADGRGEFRACGLPPGPTVVFAEGFDGSTGTAESEAPSEGVRVVVGNR